MRSESCDILVIGSGIAGLSFALHCAENFPRKNILVLSKSESDESNTRYAQGGIAAVMDHLQDSYQQHIDDTLEAGDGLCDTEVVELVVNKAPRLMLKLMEWGVHFDRHDRQLELGREGGHSANRILHCKDHTGASVGQSLLNKVRNTANIRMREGQFVLKLTMQDGNCSGALVRDGEAFYQVRAHYTMLASGGAGQVYELTSNPDIATGDGLALALEAGATLQDLAFIQFHPTVLYEPGAEKTFLISEAVRGFGAILRNHQGEDFMYRYDPRGSLATRDIVSRAIFREMQLAGTAHLWLDLRHLPAADFHLKFPSIARHLEEAGIDITTDLVPILPAAHYFCGGIETDLWAQTKVPHLLACGETARTGLHGANRLASNSLLEALVFSHQAYLRLNLYFEELPAQAPLTELPDQPPLSPAQYRQLRQKLQKLMTTHVGITRNTKGLKRALNEVRKMKQQLPKDDLSRSGRELHNMLAVTHEIIIQSLAMQENRGGFFREDLAVKMPQY